MADDRIKEFKKYLERWNENLFDEKVEEVTQYIDDNDITKEEVEALLDALPEDYFMKSVLQNIYEMDEDRFGEEETEDKE